MPTGLLVLGTVLLLVDSPLRPLEARQLNLDRKGL
jgi:hypothetical protein